MTAEEEIRKSVIPLQKPKPYYTDEEVCERFQVSKRTTKRWRDDGLIKFFRVRGSTLIRYKAQEVADFETRNEHKAIQRGKGWAR
jgi:excisionase family DNA binding protein